MRILIFSDIEGASCIHDYHQISATFGPLFEEGRGFLTSDINAAIKGLRRAGASVIDIFDGHGNGGNLIQDQIQGDAHLFGSGIPLSTLIMNKTIFEYDAMIMVGQHAAAGTTDGFLSHMYSPDYAIKINDQDVGEIASIAWLFAHHNVPTILVTGDDAAVREAKALLPGIEAVTVKKASDRTTVDCLSLEVTQTMIEEKSYQALACLHECKPNRLPPPYRLEVMFAHQGMTDIASTLPMFERKSNNEILFHTDDYIQLYKAIMSLNLAGSIFMTQNMFGEIFQIPGVGEYYFKKMNEMLDNWACNPSPFPVVKY